MTKRPEPVVVPDDFPIKRLPSRTASTKSKRRPKGAWTIRRDEAAARHAENSRYANAIRRIAGQRAAQYQPQVIEHNGTWAVALGEGEITEIIKDKLTRKQAQRLVRRAGCFVRGENVRRKRM
jgi:hypothetical protein